MSTHSHDPAGLRSRDVRLPGLDGLRGLAVMLVIAHQFQLFDDPNTLAGRIAEYVLDLGWIGVQLFFVLSGFLITRILMATREEPDHFRDFYLRRALRIFPLYFLVVLVLFVAIPFLPEPLRASATPAQAWPYVTFVSNWTAELVPRHPSLPHLWSLAVEEQFYLAWPLLLYRRSSRTVWRLCLGVAAASLAIRIVLVLGGADPEVVYEITPCRMDALALGGAAAAWLHLPRAPAGDAARFTKKLLWLATATLAVGFVGSHGYPRAAALGQTIGYSALAVCFALLVLALAHADVRHEGGIPGLFRAAWLRTVGRYSYAMYLFHEPLHQLAGHPLMRRLSIDSSKSIAANLVYVASATLVLLMLARLSFVLIERPFLRLKQAFEPRRRGAAQREGA